jgi:hypothetical protein
LAPWTGDAAAAALVALGATVVLAALDAVEVVVAALLDVVDVVAGACVAGAEPQAASRPAAVSTEARRKSRLCSDRRHVRSM